MSTIVAICPYCRVGGVRAPKSNIGASATCPKCKSSFTVMPSDGLPGWARESKPAPAPAPQPAAPSADETRPIAAMGMADVTEPSPVLTADELAEVKTKPKARPTPIPTPTPEPEEPAEAADTAFVVALVALILVGVAMLASQLPFGRFIAVGVAAVGLLGGLASLGSEGRARQAGALAAGLHVLVLVLVILLPSWLHLGPWLGSTTDEGPKGPFALEHGTGQLKPLTPTDWIEAGKSSWEFQDLRVTVRSAFVGPVELQGPNGAKRTVKGPYLHLLLRVANNGVERHVELSGWAVGTGADAVRVTDASGKPLRPATFDDGWLPDKGKPNDRLFPSKTSDVRLVFVAPPARTDSLRVQLPGAAIGLADEEIKFRLGGGLFTRGVVPER